MNQSPRFCKITKETLTLAHKCLLINRNRKADRAICIGIDKLRQVIRSGRKDLDASIAYILCIMLRGFRDVISLCKMMPNGARITTLPQIERAWCLMHDAKDRLGFTPSGFEHAALDWAKTRLEYLENDFLKQFGPGIYSSPEITCDWLACTICGKDLRSCEHVPGYVYSAKICSGLWSGNVILRGVSIVTSPRDPRCRIWPWQIQKEQRTVESTILLTTRIDEF